MGAAPGGADRSVIARWLDRAARLLLRASIVGFVVSALVHLTVAILAAGIVVAVVGPPGPSRTISADAGLAMLSETELSSLEQQDLPAQRAPSAEDLAQASATKVDIPDAPDLAPGAAAPSSGPSSAVEGLGGAGDLSGVGEGGSLGGAGGGGTKFFGVEAVGSRIAYICDVSGSMAGPKLDSLKKELVESIDALTERSSFNVALFSSESKPLLGRAKWTEANARGKKNASQNIHALTPGGATNPAPAFEDIFDLRPRPEAIYFMTDGLFAAEVADLVRQLNTQGGRIVPIHCIAFVSRDAEDILKKIAEESDGTYTFVPGVGSAP